MDAPASDRRNSGVGGYLKRFRTALRKTPSKKSIKTHIDDSAPNETARHPDSSSSKASTPHVEAQRLPSPVPPISEAGHPEVLSKCAKSTNEDDAVVPKRQLSPLRSVETPENGEHPTSDQIDAALEEEDRELYDRANSIERVEKTPQIRIRHYCHKCQSPIGTTGACGKCAHKKCSRCLRFPERKSKSDAPSQSQPMVSPPPAPTTPDPNDQMPLSYRPRDLPDTAVVSATQKVRWICHSCGAFFILEARKCQNCSHLKCSKCKRYPPPNGSGTNEPLSVREREFKKPRIRVRYTCEVCSTLFVEHIKICGRCGHVRCANCPRQPPRRGSFGDTDPEVLKAVERRLSSYALIESPPQRHTVANTA